MVRYKQQNLILDTTADKKLNATNNKIVNADKKQDAGGGKQLNAAAKLLIPIKNQITR